MFAMQQENELDPDDRAMQVEALVQAFTKSYDENPKLSWIWAMTTGVEEVIEVARATVSEEALADAQELVDGITAAVGQYHTNYLLGALTTADVAMLCAQFEDDPDLGAHFVQSWLQYSVDDAANINMIPVEFCARTITHYFLTSHRQAVVYQQMMQAFTDVLGEERGLRAFKAFSEQHLEEDK